MEDTLSRIPFDFTRIMEKQKEILAGAATEAENKLDYDAAHNEEILLAVDVVEKFLRDKGRVCYGGQAINIHLPDKHKFYDPETTIPDYDFFTPNAKADLDMLVRMFKREGFTEIGVRPGIHEGTTKVYVNFIAVADCTEINPIFYKMIAQNSVVQNGISYMDANTLRMMMYLELSRPRGEVSRWEKVFERLMLLNTYVPIKHCGRSVKGRVGRPSHIPADMREKFVEHIVTERRVMCGADVIEYYKRRLRGRGQQLGWLLSGHAPVIFYSPDPEADIKSIYAKFKTELSFKKYAAEAEFFPLVYLGYRNERDGPVLAIVQETACHAYNTVTLEDGRRMYIASFDTLITLYLSLMFRNTLQELFAKPILCLVEQLVHLQMTYRKSTHAPFPFISIECSGHQKSFQSLLREKIERIRKAKSLKARERQTRTRSRRGRTRKVGRGKKKD
jgi:hypothetical protein